MYRFLIIMILAVSVIGCRAKKESIKISERSYRLDSARSSFKDSLSDNSNKQVDISFTAWEYEYPAQTPEEKKAGITPKPRVKKKIEGRSHSSTSNQKTQVVNADQQSVAIQANAKTSEIRKEAKPTGSFRFWLVIALVFVAAAAYLVWKFNWVGIIRSIFTRNK